MYQQNLIKVLKDYGKPKVLARNNRYKKCEYSFRGDGKDLTYHLLQNLKKKYDLQTIGFFLVKKYNDLRYTFNVPYAKEALAKRMFTKDKFIADYGTGYDVYYYVKSDTKVANKVYDGVANNTKNATLKYSAKFIKDNVENIIPNESKIKITYKNENFSFDKVVISAGSWSKNLTRKFGDDFPLDTERGYHVLFNNYELINRQLGWSQSVFYLVQLAEGLRAAGTVEIAGLSKPENKKRTKMIENQARKLLPQLNEVKSTWLGFRPTMPDALPVIGQSQKNKNIIYGFGHQHIGWTLGAVTGKVINSICNDRIPNINIKPFSPSRFN